MGGLSNPSKQIQDDCNNNCMIVSHSNMGVRYHNAIKPNGELIVNDMRRKMTTITTQTVHN